MRIGFGYDVHQLAPDAALVLGGVRIPHEFGLQGHSDADVVVHALCDAMLGAAGLGDIGQHFPSSDERWRGISSLHILKAVTRLLADSRHELGNADVTIVAQRPRLRPYLPQMATALAAAANAEPAQLNIKATTTDGLGFAGAEQGIAAYAVCLVKPAGTDGGPS
jgi:2-C-methyl-D-erythritol 2,4-cyclodiphosphate synthase